jgi:hypothetical protein
MNTSVSGRAVCLANATFSRPPPAQRPGDPGARPRLDEGRRGAAQHKDAGQRHLGDQAISTAFAEFRAGDITPPDCSEFLKDGTTRASPRTFNEMRAGCAS